ncbi:MAG: beta-lactamase family protein [Fuerstiella sp.]|nr:beta-lactamase family protein [Fuerstiella sp.]
MAVTDLSSKLQPIIDEAQLPYVEVQAGGVSGSPLQFSHGFSHHNRPPGSQLFLVASITKSIVATMALKLVGEGRFSLSERVTDRLGELPSTSFRRITIRHLLTHTCGLPDQLPENERLRKSQAGLPIFLNQVGQHGTDFTPGSDCRYSSMGFLLLGEIISRATGLPLPEVLRTQIFLPSKMNDSWLGIPADRDDLLQTAVPCILPPWQQDAPNWDWNSPYWRRLGAPWGGLLTTASDLGKFCRMMLRGGTGENGQSVLTPAAINALASEQTRHLFDLPEQTWQKRPWGYGWRYAWPEHSASFGDLVPQSAVGHWGATGTIFWLDPRSQTYVVILTSTPFEQSRFTLQRLSNAVAATLL